MLRHGLPPPPGITAMPLPANRIPAGARPRQQMSARGGQLQVAGVVVGSWGPNYSYQQNMRQQPAMMGGYQGRGRGIFMGPAGGSNFTHVNMAGPRGRGQQQQHQQPRKAGQQPSFPVNNNKKNNVSLDIVFFFFWVGFCRLMIRWC